MQFTQRNARHNATGGQNRLQYVYIADTLLWKATRGEIPRWDV